MPRCSRCGAVIPGHDCPHCPPVTYHNCPRCGQLVAVINEAKRDELTRQTE